MEANGEVELDVQETLKAILHTQSRMEIQLSLVVDSLRDVMVALGIREKLELRAKELDEITPVDNHIARMAAIRRGHGR